MYGPSAVEGFAGVTPLPDPEPPPCGPAGIGASDDLLGSSVAGASVAGTGTTGANEAGTAVAGPLVTVVGATGAVTNGAVVGVCSIGRTVGGVSPAVRRRSDKAATAASKAAQMISCDLGKGGANRVCKCPLPGLTLP
jgi:hypothetical protein